VTQFSDERGAEMRELFFETAQELLQSLNEEALKLERNPADAELVRSIRRIVHTIKGDAAACGFRELSNAAHELEMFWPRNRHRRSAAWRRSPSPPLTFLARCWPHTDAKASCPRPRL
jgi:chemotaxis protein histidine kinase CheA